MRISTSAIHASAVALINDRLAELVKTQNQLSTGKRILTPADDPTAAVQALELDRALQESKQYERNANAAITRLSFEEQALADATSLLDRIRVLTIQANSGAMDETSRNSIATEIRTRLGELVDIANRRDANGEYLFAGYATLTQPFSVSGTSVTYAGDQGVRMLQTSETQTVADGHPGSYVFMDIPQGNGSFYTTASNTNTGTGVIDTGTVLNGSWIADNYTIQFTSPTTYDILDGTNTVISSGTYSGTSGTITFNGVQVNLTGKPATGDTFTVSPSGSEDIFTTISKLLTTLGRPDDSDAQNALVATELGATLSQLDRALEHLSRVRSEVGGRLSVLESGAEARADRELDMQTTLSGLRDLDFAEAISRLNVQLTGLQAAQQSYAQITQLSLFNYLR